MPQQKLFDLQRWQTLLRGDVGTILTHLLEHAVRYAEYDTGVDMEPSAAIAHSVKNRLYVPLDLPAWVLEKVAITAAERAVRFAGDLFEGKPVPIFGNAAWQLETLMNAIFVLHGLSDQAFKPVEDTVEELLRRLFTLKNRDVQYDYVAKAAAALCTAALRDKAVASDALSAFCWLYALPITIERFRDVMEALRDDYQQPATLVESALKQFRDALNTTYGSGHLNQLQRLGEAALPLRIAAETWNILDPSHPNGMSDVITSAFAGENNADQITLYAEIGHILLRAHERLNDVHLHRHLPLTLEALYDASRNARVHGGKTLAYCEVAGLWLEALGFSNATALITKIEDAASRDLSKRIRSKLQSIAYFCGPDDESVDLADLANQIIYSAKLQVRWRYPAVTPQVFAQLRDERIDDHMRDLTSQLPLEKRFHMREIIQRCIRNSNFDIDRRKVLTRLDETLSSFEELVPTRNKRSRGHDVEPGNSSKRVKPEPQREL